jgi:isoquinoline 1-oxidoreductase beta subunit
MSVVNLSRREFLSVGAAVAGSLTLGVQLGAGARPNGGAAFVPNAFIRIGKDDSILIVVARSEMGQGVHTALPMLLAEELDADWTKVRVQAAPVAREYHHPDFGVQVTGGSTSVSSSWEPLRKAGATARSMLVTAAARTWKVDPKDCRADSGYVIHVPSLKRLSFGQLVDHAAMLPAPESVTLKDPRDFKLIGRQMQRLDLPEKANGTATFGIDVTVPGMLVAVIARPPVFGAKIKSVDSSATLAVAGVRRVVTIDAGIAVVAENFWSANRGREALRAVWDEGELANFDDRELLRQYRDLAEKPAAVAKEQGDVNVDAENIAHHIEVRYEFPFLAHTPMEPLNCVADVRRDRCEIWVGTQFQTRDREIAAQAAGLRVEQVELHTMLMGGGFGRRGVPDGHFVREAVQLSRIMKAPVKVIWTRSDDIQGGYYRPAYSHAVAGDLGRNGDILAWRHRVVGQSILTGTAFEQMAVADGVDRSSVYSPYYEWPNFRIELRTTQLGIPVWSWRSVGGTHNAFAIECFMDELAHATGKDPYEFRRALLAPKHRKTLDLAAEKAGWHTKLPPGRGRGIAVYPFHSFVAQIAEVSVAADGSLEVDRVVCAVDCGTVVNPDIVRAQMEGGIAMGLSAALHEQVTFERGRVQQSNFADYPILRIHEMPRIEVHILPSDERPLGVGESGVPPIAPALANAIFAATGRRIRRLPLSRSDENPM